MQMIELRGRLYEVTVVSDVVSDELYLECWDMSPNGGALFSMIRDSVGVLQLRPLAAEIPVDLLEQVAAIAGAELGEV